MVIYTDGSYKDGRIGMGVVIIDREVIREKISQSSCGVDSAEAEILALVIGINLAISRGIKHIYSDAKWLSVYLSGNKKSRKYNLTKLMNEYSRYTGDIIWIPRARNKIADNLARAAVFALNWEKEELIGGQLNVIPMMRPSHFYVGKIDSSIPKHVVNRKNGRWYCTCSKAEDFALLGLHCRHIHAVRLFTHEATAAGELAE